jgi:hypothetical protein
VIRGGQPPHQAGGGMVVRVIGAMHDIVIRYCCHEFLLDAVS